MAEIDRLRTFRGLKERRSIKVWRRSGAPGLVGLVTTSHAGVAVLDGRPGDAAALMDAAAELAGRLGELGESDPLGFEFGPRNVLC